MLKASDTGLYNHQQTSRRPGFHRTASRSFPPITADKHRRSTGFTVVMRTIIGRRNKYNSSKDNRSTDGNINILGSRRVTTTLSS